MSIWVVGGTSGIGAACVSILQADVFNGGKQVIFSGEAKDVRSKFALVEFLNKYERPKAMIYSAGINKLDWVPNVDISKAEDIFDVNVLGFIRCVQVAEDSLKSIVVIGSDAAWKSMRASSVYCASKAALHQMAMCMAREFAPKCRVNVVAPGMTEPTNMQKQVDKEVQEIRGWTEDQMLEYENSYTPMGRRCRPQEVAKVACQVLEGPEYLTGAIIPVTGAR